MPWLRRSAAQKGAAQFWAVLGTSDYFCGVVELPEALLSLLLPLLLGDWLLLSLVPLVPIPLVPPGDSAAPVAAPGVMPK
jgi:hypothetical protein